jgi:hypothetical protein
MPAHIMSRNETSKVPVEMVIKPFTKTKDVTSRESKIIMIIIFIKMITTFVFFVINPFFVIESYKTFQFIHSISKLNKEIGVFFSEVGGHLMSPFLDENVYWAHFPKNIRQSGLET